MRSAIASIAAVFAITGFTACAGDEDRDEGTTPPPTASTSPSSSDGGSPSTEVTSAPSTRPPKLAARPIAEFDQPVALAAVPSRPSVYYVVEKAGRLRLLESDERGGVVLDIVEQVASGGERGLLGIAVAPDGRHLYLNYTNRDGDTRIVEYAIRDGGAIDASTRRELLAVDQPYPNHNGGDLAFGPDEMLYIALGDGGSSGDPQGNAQNLGSLLGKILRIDPRGGGGEAYRIPAGNPFAGRAGARPEIWAYGLRNPWRFSFDRPTGALWIGDVGQNKREEISRSPRESRGGENYGWDRLEGTLSFEGSAPEDHVLPVHDYSRDDGNCAVTGGYVYRGEKIPALQGWYLFGDYCRGELLAVRSDAQTGARSVPLGASVASLVAFAEDGEGELFALSLQGGVYRLEAADS